MLKSLFSKVASLRWLVSSGLIMNNYGLIWLDIYIHGYLYLYLAYLISIFSLVLWFLYFFFVFFFLFLAAHVSRLRRAWNLMGTLVRNGLRFFPLLGKKTILYRSQVFLINFLETFSNFRSNRLNNATVCETPMLKKYFNSWKKYFLASNFIENQVSIISALFPYFSVFSLPKLN